MLRNTALGTVRECHPRPGEADPLPRRVRRSVPTLLRREGRPLAYRIAVLLGTSAIAAAAALAAATPVTPPPGALISPSRLVFSWTLPANEQSEALYIA